MYNVNILTKCDNEEEMAVVIAAALSAFFTHEDNNRRNNLVVRNIKRLPESTPLWGKIGRHERFERKLNT